MLRPVPPVGEIPQATAVLARKVHPRGTDEMRVRDALGPLFADTDFTTGVFAEMYPALGQPGLSPALLTMVMILQHRHDLSDADADADADAARAGLTTPPKLVATPKPSKSLLAKGFEGLSADLGGSG